MKTVDLHAYGHASHMSAETIKKLQNLWDKHNFGVQDSEGAGYHWHVHGHTKSGEHYVYEGDAPSVEAAIDMAHQAHG